MSAVVSDHNRVGSFAGEHPGLVKIGRAGWFAKGVVYVVKGAKFDVNDVLDLSGVSPERLVWTNRLGAVGEIGRGIGIGLVGFFLFRAAMTYSGSEATGLDGALGRLATHSWGLLVVLVVAIGFAAYGVFCLATFPRRRLQAP